MKQEDHLSFVFKKLSDIGHSLTFFIRYEAALNRSYDRALKQLLLLRSKPALGSIRNLATTAPAPPPDGHDNTASRRCPNPR
jgi:hypothetical protein